MKPPPLVFALSVGLILFPTSTVPEAEQVVACDGVGNCVLAAIDFSENALYGHVKLAVSNDSGATWAEQFLPKTDLEQRDPSIVIRGSDVWIGVLDEIPGGERESEQYASGGVDNDTRHVGSVGPKTSFPERMILASSLTTCKTLIRDSQCDSDPLASNKLQFFPGDVSVCHGTLPLLQDLACNPVFTFLSGFSADSPKIAIDQSSGELYAVWELFTGCGTKSCAGKYIAFSESADGVNWSAPLQINPASQIGVSWPQVTVSSGVIYVVYDYQLVNGHQHWCALSSDGVSFSAPVATTPIFQAPNYASIFRKNVSPAIAVSNGTLYDTFPAWTQGRSHIAVAVNGKMYKADDSLTGQRFMPAIAIDSDGLLVLTWFDTRNSPSNVAQFDIYASTSADGKLWAANTRITQSLGNAGKFLGDYSGLWCGTGACQAVWNDGVNLQTATLGVP